MVPKACTSISAFFQAMPMRRVWAQFKLDEAVLSVGAAYHTALAMEFLSSAEGARDEL